MTHNPTSLSSHIKHSVARFQKSIKDLESTIKQEIPVQSFYDKQELKLLREKITMFHKINKDVSYRLIAIMEKIRSITEHI